MSTELVITIFGNSPFNFGRLDNWCCPGRVARAGRSGTAYSLIALDEMPALVDLHLFLGRPVKQVPKDGLAPGQDWDGYLGRVAQSVIDEGSSIMRLWHQESVELHNMIKVYTSAYKQYLRSCPNPSHEAIKKAKEIRLDHLGPHPVFVAEDADLEANRLNLLEQMKTYRPHHVTTQLSLYILIRPVVLMKYLLNRPYLRLA